LSPERICEVASLEGHIPRKFTNIQEALDAIAQLDAYNKIFDSMVTEYKATLEDVDKHRKLLYSELYNEAHGIHYPILIIKKDYKLGEFLAIVSYYKLQDNWINPLEWEIA
jgi:hypothetical protein